MRIPSTVTIRPRNKPWFDSKLRKNIGTRDRIPSTVAIRPRDKPLFASKLRKNIGTRDRLRKRSLKSKKEIDWINYYNHKHETRGPWATSLTSETSSNR